MNPFKILGITSAATKSQIRTAYLLKAKEFHPDSPTGSPQKFKELHEAYQYLNTHHKTSTLYSQDSEINFSSLIKNYRRAGKSVFEKPRHEEPLAKTEKSGANLSILIQGVVFVLGLGVLYLMDASGSRFESFESTFETCRNKVEYSSSVPFDGEKWFEIKY